MKIEFCSTITRQMMQENPRSLFIFGDNEVRKGLGGQAREMRGEPNAQGVRTKRYPLSEARAYWHDSTYPQNVIFIQEDIDRVKACLQSGLFDTLVFPGTDLDHINIGNGLADLPRNAPKTWEQLKWELKNLVEYVEKEL